MNDEYAGYRFLNGTREEFAFEGWPAAIVTPENPHPDGRWAIYTEYFGAFPVVAEALLKNGFRIVRLENENRWGLDSDEKRRWRFADYLERDRGFSHRCVTIGMSCGGLHAIRFAALQPERIAAMYLDAPVINLLSCPMAYGRRRQDEAIVQECLQALKLTEAELLSYRKHPLDVLPILVDAKVPVALVYGEADETVPFQENGRLLLELYQERDLPIVAIGKPGCGHHPHGLEDPQPIVDFILKHLNS